MDLLNEFKKFLFSQDTTPSKVTVKNYLSDINHFIKWFEKKSAKPFAPEAITKTTIDNYKTEIAESISPVSLERHLSSLRKFFFFLVLENKISKDPFKPLALPQNENDPWKLKDFKNFLYVYNASHLTIKNYIIDVKQFLNWAEEVTGLLTQTGANVFEAINSDLLEEYKKRLMENGKFSASTINRKLSSLRKYVSWALEEHLISPFELGLGNYQPENPNPKFIHEPEFSQLPKVEIPAAKPQYSKFPPFRLLQKITKGIDSLVEASVITNLAKGVETSLHLAWTIKGQPIFDKAKKIKLPRYIDKVDIFGVKNIKKEFYAPLELSTANLPRYKKVWLKLRYQRPKWYKTYHSYAFAHYLNFVVLMIFVAGLALGFYNGFVKASNPTLAANPNLPTNPLRILSFQGRLTDNNSNPITSATNLRFAIYRDSTATGAATLLWQEVDQVAPDQDGIFNVILGNTATVCANPNGTILGKCAIYSSLFSENNALWIGVTVESTSELAPRQQIATVAYAVNSETLQGLLPITATASGITNVVLALNSNGNLTIGSGATYANPVFTANGNYTLSTVAGSPNGDNIILSPDVGGKIGINTTIPLTTLDVRGNSGTLAVASVSGKTSSAALIVNNDGVGDIFTASASGYARFTITNSGAIGLGPNGTNVGTNAQCLTGGTIPAWGTCGSGTGVNWWNQVGGLVYPTNNGWDLGVGGTSTASSLLTFLHTDSNFSNNPALTVWSSTTHGGANYIGMSASATDATIDSSTGVINIGHGGGTLFIQTDIQNDSANNSGAIQITDRLNVLPAATSNNVNASLIVNNPGTGDIFTASQGGTQKFTVTNSGGIRLGTNEGTALNCLLSGGTGVAASWGTCDPNGINGWWNQVGGLVYPTSSLYDFAVGGTSTASATFSVTGNQLTFPIASLAGRLTIADNLKRVSPTPIATISGNTGSVILSLNNNGLGDLLTASNGGNTKFTVDRNGFLGIGGAQIIPGNTNYITAANFSVTNTGVISAATSNTINSLSINSGALSGVTGYSQASGTFTLNGSGAVSVGTGTNAVTVGNTGGGLTLPSTSITLSAFGGGAGNSNAVLYANSSNALAQAVTTNTGNCLLSNGSGGNPSWGTCPATGANWWNQVGGLVYPTSSLYDFAVGGTSTASATFSVTGNMFSFPIASMDGRLTVADNLKRLSPTPIATISGNTGSVVLSLNNNGRGDLLTASTGGNTKFTVDTNGFLGIGTQIIPGNANELTLRNGETIDNATNGTLNLGTTILSLTGTTTITSTSLATFTTSATLSFATAATNLTIGATSGTLNLQNPAINVGAGSTTTISTTSNATLNISAGTGTLHLNDVANGAITTGTGNISLNGSTTVATTKTLTLTDINANNQVLYGAPSTGVVTGVVTTSTPSQCLLSGATIPAWGSCPSTGGINWWNQVGGLVYPTSSLYDFAVGGTSTSSATFSVTGNQLSFPIASLAGRLTIADNLKRLSPTPIATISGNTGSVILSLNNNGRGDLLTASTGGNTKFTVDTNGFLGLGGTRIIPGNTSDITLQNGETIDNATNGTLNIGTTILSLTGTTTLTASSLTTITTSTPLAINGAATITTNQSNLTLFNSTATTLSFAGAATTMSMGGSGGTLTLGNGGAFTITTGTNQNLLINPNGSGTLSLNTAGTGATSVGNATGGVSLAGNITLSSATYATCGLLNTSGNVVGCGSLPAGSTNWWNQFGGVVYPTNSGWDLAIGGTSTASAKFAILGIKDTFPQATIAGRLFVGDDLRRLSPTPIATISGNTGSVILSINNNSPTGDLITASSSGIPRFKITNGGSVYASSFFDYDNTSYFLDPAATGTSLTTAGSVGVGTTVPGNNLAIVKATNDTIPALGANGGSFGIFKNDGQASGNYGLISGVLDTGNVFMQAQRIDLIATAYDLLLQPNGGNVGIGTISPGALLDVSSATSGNINLTKTGTTAGSASIFNNGNLHINGSNGAGASSVWLDTDSSTGGFAFHINANSTGSNTLIQEAGGNVGIGTTAPTAALQIDAGAGTANIQRAALVLSGSFQQPLISTNSATALRLMGNNATGAGDCGVTLFTPTDTDKYMFGQYDNCNTGSFSGIKRSGYFTYIGAFFNNWAPQANIPTSGTFISFDIGNNRIDFNSSDNLRDMRDDGGVIKIGEISNFDPQLTVGLATPGSAAGNIRFQVTNSSTSTAAAQIWNVFPNSANGSCTNAVCHTALSLKLGQNNSTSGPGTADRYINFARGNGALIGYIRGAGGAAATDTIAYSTAGGDYAEWFKKENVNDVLNPGDLICVNSNGNVVKCNNSNSKMLGVVSDSYGFIGNEVDANLSDPSRVVVGLVGQIQTRINSQNGEIQAGDLLTYSSTSGVAAKAVKAGPVIGMALGNGSNGKINVYVNPTWYDPDVQLTSTGNLGLYDYTIATDPNYTIPHYFTLNDASGGLITRVGAYAELATAKLRAGLIDAQQITTKALSINGVSIRDYIASVVNDILNQNNYVSPISSKSSLAIYATDATSSAVVAGIDNAGNATFSGNLNVGNEATIGGTLRAKKIIADQIEGLNVSASTVSATNITNVTNIYSTDPFPTISASPSSVDNSNIFAGLLTQNKFVNIATLSSQLAYVDNLNANTATFANGLMVYGSSSLSDTSINGQLSINGTFILNNNSVNVLGSDLNLQPLRQGGLSIMAGLIYVDTDGNVRVGGNLEVKGTLFANNISPSDGGNVNIGSSSGLLTIKPTGDVIASGAGTFDKLNIGSLVGTALAVSPTEIIATGSAGSATIKAGRTEITIDNKLVTDKSLIYITPTTQTYQPLFLLRQVPNTSFTVGIETPDISPIKFNWIIIN